MNIIAELML